ncbi:MAG: hypothetical protein ACPG21_08565 [Crocinitomicaceae bacterium]
MRKGFKIAFILIGLLILTFSCNKQSDYCYEEKPAASFMFDYPDTVQVGQVFTVDINYLVENSCGDFGQIDAQKIENTLEVKLFTVYDGCQCEEEFVEKSATYPVTFEEEGTYELKMWVADGFYDAYIIYAQE